MKTVEIKQVLNASPHSIWDQVKTGADVNKWLPVIATCELVGEGVGAKRKCTTIDGKTLEETIVNIDNQNMIFEYSIDSQDMMPIKNGKGIFSVSNNMGKAEVLWKISFDMIVEDAYPEVEKAFKEIYHMGLTNLEKIATSNQR